VPKYLIVKQVSNGDNVISRFEKTNSLFLSQKNYYYNLINTPEGVLPFRPNFGINYDFTSIDELVNHIRSKFTGSSFQIEVIEEEGKRKVIISFNSSVIAILSE
jgi:hypothetical protein